MKLRASSFFVVCSTLLCAGVARADIPPPPEDMREYVVETSSALSAILYRTINFNRISKHQLKDTTSPWAPTECEMEVRELYESGLVIQCMERDTCYPKSSPRCQFIYDDVKDAEPTQVIKATPIAETDRSNGDFDEPVPVM